MKAKIRSKNQNINIDIAIENSLLSKNKMLSHDDQEDQQPEQRVPQIAPVYNQKVPDEFNLYNAIMASRNLYELAAEREPVNYRNLVARPEQATAPRPIAQQTAAPRPITQQTAAPRPIQQATQPMQTPVQIQAPQTPMQATAQAPPPQTPAQVQTQQTFAPQTASLFGSLITPAQQSIVPTSARPLTVQGTPQQLVPRNMSPPRNLVTTATPATVSDIRPDMLYTAAPERPQNRPIDLQPISETPARNIQFEIEPLVKLQLPNDEPIDGFRRPLTNEEEDLFISKLNPQQQEKRRRHIEGLLTGNKTVQIRTIKKYRLEKYFENIKNKFGYART